MKNYININIDAITPDEKGGKKKALVTALGRASEYLETFGYKIIKQSVKEA